MRRKRKQKKPPKRKARRGSWLRELLDILAEIAAIASLILALIKK